MQPGTDLLFAVRAPIDLHGGGGKLYVVDKTTAVATFVGNTAPSSSRTTIASHHPTALSKNPLSAPTRRRSIP